MAGGSAGHGRSRCAAVMLQGTGSDVGKSLLVAALCRAYVRRGLRVRPFKPQNMSNNAAVTEDGGEIGRAQALQARACRVPPSVDMNPVLLKPQSDTGAQVVVHGRVRGDSGAAAYQTAKGSLLPEVLESFTRLEAEADLVVVEGAGSPAEINLPGVDIANMGFAAAANVPALLVGDIDRGGVIASIVGTFALLPAAERHRLKGFIINKFRGDIGLFDGGIEAIRARTGWQNLGVVPYFRDAWRLPAEDAVAVENRVAAPDRAIRVAVPVFSRIANFDDLDPLIAEPDVAVAMVGPGRALPGDADLVILPGTKATIADLAFLRDQGWDVDIRAHHRRGGVVLGLCGGYQILGRHIADPRGIEGLAHSVGGLGLLDIETVMDDRKTLRRVAGRHLASGQPIVGFEMHIGRTTGPDTDRPFLALGSGGDGAVSRDGLVMGCYVHGLFAADEFRRAFLRGIKERATGGLAYEAEIDRILEALADHVEAHLDFDRILEIAHARQ